MAFKEKPINLRQPQNDIKPVENHRGIYHNTVENKYYFVDEVQANQLGPYDSVHLAHAGAYCYAHWLNTNETYIVVKSEDSF